MVWNWVVLKQMFLVYLRTTLVGIKYLCFDGISSDWVSETGKTKTQSYLWLLILEQNIWIKCFGIHVFDYLYTILMRICKSIYMYLYFSKIASNYCFKCTIKVKKYALSGQFNLYRIHVNSWWIYTLNASYEHKHIYLIFSEPP